MAFDRLLLKGLLTYFLYWMAANCLKLNAEDRITLDWVEDEVYR